ncbi:unnamed protein product [Effrenium voratum]|nr:unnamed protein product [Effrenium voratum]
MEYEPEGAQELLIDSAQEKTARRTRQLLLAARLAFFFSHGLLIVCASVALGWETNTSWWQIFSPAWLGDALCVVLVILSWFGSCPYIHLCLQERQARLGDNNPSILTDILPDIFMGVLSLVYLILALVAEILLCRYLDELRAQRAARTPTACATARLTGFTGVESRGSRGSMPPMPPLGPSARPGFGQFLILVSLLTCCRGVCISTSGELFSCLGAGALGSSVLGLLLPDGPFSTSAWVLFLPWLAAVLALELCSSLRLQRLRAVLCREEVILRMAEQVILFVVLLSLLAIIFEVSAFVQLGAVHAGAAGVTLGSGVCALALLRGRMAVTENRFGALSERLLIADIRGEVNPSSMRSSVISGVGAEVPLANASMASHM